MQKFYTDLMDISQRYYDQWCKEKGVYFDAKTHKQWHHEFDPHNKTIVKDIVPADISDWAVVKRDKSVKDFMKETCIDELWSSNPLRRAI